uniref:hypothetical protein n=1 Tax=Flavobacterium sp. TaxID=239 RepID=UPI00404A61D9
MQSVLGCGYLQEIEMVAVMHLQKKIIKVPSALAVAVSKGIFGLGEESCLVAFVGADAKNLINQRNL